MIQRIQSVFLAAAIILLLIVTLGATLFNFQGQGDTHFALTMFGVKSVMAGVTSPVREIPFYFAGVVLIILCLFTLITFKNLKLQLALARFTAFAYFIVLVFAGFAWFLGTYFTDDKSVSASPGLGIYLLIAGFPLVLLAIRGINKDKKLIDSVNRLR